MSQPRPPAASHTRARSGASAGARNRRFLLALALGSGVAALIYETLWIRWFALLFGNTAYAASATLCAFFSGLAIGSAFFGRRAGRSPAPLRLYAGIELGAAAAALLVPFVFQLYDLFYAELYAALADAPSVFVAVKFALALGAMLPASILLGGGVPALVAATTTQGKALADEGGPLYATNTLGACLGAALGGLLLPDWLGISATYGVAIGCSLAIGIAAWLAARSATPKPTVSASLDAGRAKAAPQVIAFASGFGTLAFEVLLIHGLGQLTLHSTYTIATILIAVLASLAAATLIATSLARRTRPDAVLRTALLAQGAVVLVMPAWLVSMHGGIETAWLVTALHDVGLAEYASVLALVVTLTVPGFLIGGMIFPLTFQLVSDGRPGRQIGGLLAANTAGGIVGSLAASFLLLDRVGLWISLGWLGIAYLAAALVVSGSLRARVLVAVTAGCLGLSVTASPLSPWSQPLVSLWEGDRLLALEEGSHGVVSVVERPDGSRRIKVDDQYQFGSSTQRALYERQGNLPLLLHPAPRRVAFIGSATGSVAASAVLHPVEQIDLIELVPEVHMLAAEYFAATNRGVHGDPRTRLVHEDGRNHLRAAQDRYDVIVEDLFVPRRPSSTSMYSVNHYREVREHLSPDGVFCQWQAVYQHDARTLELVVASFLEVFPDATLWRPYTDARFPILGLVGTRGAPPSAQAIAARTAELAGFGVEDRWVTDPAGVWVLYVGRAQALLAGNDQPLVQTDDRPRLEFLAARGSSAAQLDFVGIGLPRLFDRLARALDTPDPVFPNRPSEPPVAGRELARSALSLLRGDTAAAQRDWERASRRLPEHLLATPDPTFVWDGRPRKRPLTSHGRPRSDDQR